MKGIRNRFQANYKAGNRSKIYKNKIRKVIDSACTTAENKRVHSKS